MPADFSVKSGHENHGLPMAHAGCKVEINGRIRFCGRKKWTKTIYTKIRVFPKIGVPQNGWFLMEFPVKIHDLGVPLFLETP